MNTLLEREFDEKILDELAPSTLKRENDILKDGFHQSEIDWTITGHKSRPANIDYMRIELAESIARLCN